jgi:predicted RNase H-like HicB family nuclease
MTPQSAAMLLCSSANRFHKIHHGKTFFKKHFCREVPGPDEAGNRGTACFPGPSSLSGGATEEEVKKSMREAMEFHIAGLREQGWELPEPHSFSTYLEIPV